MSKRISIQWVNRTAVLLTAVAGLFIGYLCGLVLTVYGSEHSLRASAHERMYRSEQFPTEGRNLLNRMNASTDPPCSEAEMAAFRRLVMNARYVKEVGRMRGDRLACSANLNRGMLPETPFQPAFRDVDDVLIYTGIKPLNMGPFTPIVMRKGDAYVALDPYDRDNMPSSMRFTLTMRNAPASSNHLGGSLTPLSGSPLIQDGSGRAGGILYATVCSTRYPPCITATIDMKQLLLEQGPELKIFTAAGGILGVGLGLICASFYRLRRGLEHQLRRAIRRGLLGVVYQPLVDMTTGEVGGAEALVRWTDEDNVAVQPDVFVKVAEERGFVDQITKLVVGRVLAEFGAHLRTNLAFRINVNVAASDLTDPVFHAMLDEALREARVAPASLGIEITEGASARHEPAIQAISRLRKRGHKVYIDDFGTGYSSLAYLKDLAVDGIKIDRAFTRVIGTDSVTVGILPQILAMAESLQLAVVAEGVETVEQQAYFQQSGIPITGQGWLFGRPVKRNEFRRLWLGAPAEEAVGGIDRPLKPVMEGGLTVAKVDQEALGGIGA